MYLCGLVLYFDFASFAKRDCTTCFGFQTVMFREFYFVVFLHAQTIQLVSQANREPKILNVNSHPK